MGSYSTKIDLGFETKTFEDIKNTYLFIETIIDELGLTSSRKSVSFLYDIGEIFCSSDSYSEFCEEAFGQEIGFTDLTIHINSGDEDIHFIVHPKRENNEKNISIGSHSRKKLSDIIEIINRKKEEKNKNQSVIQNNFYGDNIEIKDNATITNSNVGGSNNTVHTINSNSKGFWSSVWSSVISRGIWWLLGIIIFALGIWLGFYQN